ncbi:MAG TPA: hypothetical protein V6D17_01345 [Candidatus Obscuribacterales bacterium]
MQWELAGRSEYAAFEKSEHRDEKPLVSLQDMGGREMNSNSDATRNLESKGLLPQIAIPDLEAASSVQLSENRNLMARFKGFAENKQFGEVRSDEIISVKESGDGGTTITQADGTKTTVWKDGTRRVERPEGTGFVRRPDGTLEHWGPEVDDNYKETRSQDGKKHFLYSDGVEITVNRNGSLTYRQPDGTVSTVTMEPPDPTIISLNPEHHKPTWKIETVGPDGKTVTKRTHTAPPHAAKHLDFPSASLEKHLH